MREIAVALARGRAAHPDLALCEEDFGPFLARAIEGRTEGDGEGGRAGKGGELPVEDLFLACACACEVRGAAEAFEAKLGRIVRRAVARVLPTAVEQEEAQQRVRDHLLVRGLNGPPRIASYRGEGPLSGWVAVAAIRLAVSMGRTATAERRLRAKAVGEATGANPELLAMKGQLAKEFEAAVEEALARLTDRERLVLRLYLVSGMTLVKIARSLGVTPQAVSRQLEKVRASILSDVHRMLGERLSLPKGEVASVLRMVASRLNMSISRILEPE
jgi:RNA polymerase sigma-70 factor (ECF subfamily)